jgi:predicted nucleic acid-binding protein
VLATAVSASADYLVTGDNRFVTRVQLFQGVTLMSPRDFITLLDEL